MPGRKEELRDTVWRSDPHTLVKHLVYRHYLECWMPKILQGFPRATIVDAFAGPGTYADGLDGSPILVAKTFLAHSAHARFVGRLDLICLEQREDRVDRLRHEVAALGPTPKLTVTVVEPGEFVAEQPRLAERAHGGEAARPVLWLLDPFKITSLPFETVIACLAGRRDEAVVTFFVDEMHRFCTRDGFDKALNRHFGSGRWTTARDVAGEGPRKEALVTAYREGLDAEGLLTGHFGVRVRNDTARYHLVFATHSEYGLKCWNPVKWKLDSFAGTGASAATAEQPDLFGVSYIGELRTALRAYSGTEQSWRALLAQTIQRGFMERHLREALDALAAEGLAFRVDRTEARSAWPEGCIVRFYEPEDADVEVVEPLDSQTAAREDDGISS
jgi:three-Cys-motif partner protein